MIDLHILVENFLARRSWKKEKRYTNSNKPFKKKRWDDVLKCSQMKKFTYGNVAFIEDFIDLKYIYISINTII